MTAELKTTHLIYTFFGSIYVKYNSAKFHHCGICAKIFRGGDGFLVPPPSVSSPEKDHLE